MPAAMIVPSSETVISARYGLTTSEDSTPTKMLLDTLKASAPLMRMDREKRRANSRTKKGMTPMW